MTTRAVCHEQWWQDQQEQGRAVTVAAKKCSGDKGSTGNWHKKRKGASRDEWKKEWCRQID